MASDVDISNLALSHFGQAADISDLNPPDGSIEAELCARFFPVARDELLEEYDWTFARRRATIAELTNDREDFEYRYARPSDCLKERRLLPDGYSNDQNDIAVWQREGDSIYTSESLAVLVYTFLLEDTTKFSPLFVIALTWRLASYIAGPITKDQSGGTALRLRNVADTMAQRAKVADANMDRMRSTYSNTAQRSR